MNSNGSLEMPKLCLKMSKEFPIWFFMYLGGVAEDGPLQQERFLAVSLFQNKTMIFVLQLSPPGEQRTLYYMFHYFMYVLVGWLMGGRKTDRVRVPVP